MLSMPAMSFLTTLTLHHFRNYAHVSLSLSSAPVVLTGPNGAGKTNLLEAVSLLAPGRGFRRCALSEMARDGAPWAVAAQILWAGQVVDIGTALDVEEGGGEKRRVKIDGRLARSHAQLHAAAAVIWLVPQMDQLFMEGGSARRKFLDRLVFIFDVDHAGRVQRYDTAMRERNRLLAEARPDVVWLSALESNLAEMGTAIAIARMETVAHINAMMEAASATPFPQGHMTLSGFLEGLLSDGITAVDTEQRLREALEANRREDASAGRTLLGAHRTQVDVIYLEKNRPVAECSTGEQKAMLLSIVLAEARAAAHWRGITPVVLLDEVVAHLDSRRRAALFDALLALGAQAWLTGTDPEVFAPLGSQAQHFRVDSGCVHSAA